MRRQVTGARGLVTGGRTLRWVAGAALAVAALVGGRGEHTVCSAPPAEGQAKPEPADNSYCLVCHANYETEQLVQGHQPAGVGCEQCHGMSVKHSGDEDAVTPPDRMFAKHEITAFCQTCHEKATLVKREDHQEFFQRPDPGETCGNCHTEKHCLKVRTRVWDKKTRKLRKDDGVRMMLKDSPATEGAARSSTPAPKLDHGATLFRRDNLVAWCFVPYDAKRRGPEERAAMLERLGIKQLAYDWRAEHVPTFDAELDALARHGIRLTAFWFPGTLNNNARTILDLLRRHKVQTQLWVTGGDQPTATAEEQEKRVEAEAARIRPIAEEAAKIGCTVELYNHGGWFGEPENQIAILKRLNLPNVGLVYNLHHGHGHLDRLPRLLATMRPYLHALNLNGMIRDGDRRGMKILPLGQGDLDLGLLKTIVASGYQGPIGILNHTGADAEGRLRDNLDGLDGLVAQLDGREPGPQPVLRTWTRPAQKVFAK